MSQQGLRQASVRAVTGTSGTYEGDWHALFDLAAIPAGDFDGRLLAWINKQLAAIYTSLPEAQQAYAAAQGAYNWASLGSIFTPTALGASLLGFWDAERADLITQTVGSVSSWKDVVAGYDAAQATGGSQPIYSVTSFNNRPGVTFDGVDDHLTLASQPFVTGATPCELWVLAGRTALGTDTNIRVSLSFGGNTQQTALRAYTVGVSGTSVAAGSVGTGSATVAPAQNTTDAFGRHVRRFVVSPTQARVEVDSVTGTSSAAVPATGSARARIGANTLDTAAQFAQEAVSAILVTQPLTTTQAAQLYGWLNLRR